eukprot:TRINITY_DN112997_c0_g1_i1.p1 TRINITY_DN112997_c0_g1~~TRINITY_DN112997_c0_g1_i1.p1  ORF type:complete len:101 (-),score=4.39 TRINITY_DN112997_c0_g1_i1:13-315(-)
MVRYRKQRLADVGLRLQRYETRVQKADRLLCEATRTNHDVRSTGSMGRPAPSTPVKAKQVAERSRRPGQTAKLVLATRFIDQIYVCGACGGARNILATDI